MDSDYGHVGLLITTKYRVQKGRLFVKQKRLDLQKLKDSSQRDKFVKKISQRR